VRMSRALNYGNLPISAKIAKDLRIPVMTGADSRLYIFRVRELKAYLHAAIGVSPVVVTKGFNKAFANQRGIIAFDVAGWPDASGHVALWDGKLFRDGGDDYRNQTDDPSTSRVEGTTKQ